MRTRRRILQGLAALLSSCGRESSFIWPNTDSGVTEVVPGVTTPQSTPYSDDATGWVLLEFVDHPALLQEGGFIHVTVDGVLLIVTAGSAAGSWVAMDRICSHQGCPIIVNFGRLACPCHGSLWDDDGQLVGGPARNQAVYPTYGAEMGVWVHVTA